MLIFSKPPNVLRLIFLHTNGFRTTNNNKLLENRQKENKTQILYKLLEIFIEQNQNKSYKTGV
jgi:hypothetical protein